MSAKRIVLTPRELRAIIADAFEAGENYNATANGRASPLRSREDYVDWQMDVV